MKIIIKLKTKNEFLAFFQFKKKKTKQNKKQNLSNYVYILNVNYNNISFDL